MADQLLSVKTDIFNAAMRDMKIKLGSAVTQKQIVDAEVRKIIEKTIKLTDTATKASIQQSIVHRGNWTTYGGKKYKLSWKMKNEVWSGIQKHAADSLQKKLAAMSLARRTWWELGLKIGPTDAPVQTKRAVSRVDPATNVSIAREETNGNYGLTIENRSPLIQWSHSRQALFAAIAGRVNFFKQNLKRGVFNSLETVAKKYPGIQLTK